MPLTPTQLVQIFEALPAYAELAGEPESEQDLRARVGALIAVTVEAAGPTEALIDAVLQALPQRGAADELAKRAQQWLQTQEDDLVNVVSAYVQQVGDRLEHQELADVAKTAIALLQDGRLSPSEGRQLVHQVIKSFDLGQALGRWVSPQFVELAQRVARYRSQADLQADVFSIAQAYLEKFGTAITPALMQQILQQGSLNLAPEELLAGDVGAIAQTLSFKIQLLEADPPVTKSAAAIAEQVHDAVTAFKSRQSAADLMAPKKIGDLGVSSPLRFE